MHFKRLMGKPGGVALVSAGILLLALDGWRRGRLHRHTVGFALANAGVIAAYTLVDGIGARHKPHFPISDFHGRHAVET